MPVPPFQARSVGTIAGGGFVPVVVSARSSAEQANVLAGPPLARVLVAGAVPVARIASAHIPARTRRFVRNLRTDFTFIPAGDPHLLFGRLLPAHICRVAIPH